MAVRTDPLQNIVNVSWGGSIYLLLWGYGQPASPAPFRVAVSDTDSSVSLLAAVDATFDITVPPAGALPAWEGFWFFRCSSPKQNTQLLAVEFGVGSLIDHDGHGVTDTGGIAWFVAIDDVHNAETYLNALLVSAINNFTTHSNPAPSFTAVTPGITILSEAAVGTAPLFDPKYLHGILTLTTAANADPPKASWSFT
jgi:hypothetical protein